MPSLTERFTSVAATANALGSIAPNRSGRLLAWITVLLIPVKQRISALADLGLPLRVELNGHRHDIRIRDRGELIATVQVLCEREYDLALQHPPSVILDLGSHIGLSVLWFSSHYPDADVIAVEPDPRNYAQLERHAGGLPNVRLVCAATSSEPGEGKMSRGRFSWSSRVVANEGDVPIRLMTVDQLMGEADGRGLLKIDIEGSEWDALRVADLTRFDAIVGELHKDLIPVSQGEFLSLLGEFEILQDGGDQYNSVFCALRPGATRSEAQERLG